MDRAEIISVIALLASVSSVGFSVYFQSRDRARLKTMSTFYPGYDGGAAHMSVSVVNAGRRPIILRMWGGFDKNGHWVGTSLNKEQSGLRLAEHDRFDMSFGKDDLDEHTPDDVIEFVDLWVEDTLGRRHVIKDARANIEKLRKS